METSRAEQRKSEAQPPFTDHQPPFLPDSNEETTFNLRAALDSWIGLVLRDKPTQQLPRGGQDADMSDNYRLRGRCPSLLM